MSKERWLAFAQGATRVVICAGPYAFKLPTPLSGWRNFLFGLLGNMQERAFSVLDGCCPVVASIPGGWLLVARRARVMTEDEFGAFDVEKFCEREGYIIPAEHKSDSFGYINGAVVAVDYGGFGR